MSNKNTFMSVAFTTTLAVSITNVFAQTTYDGSGSINSDSNWSNLKPSTAGNPGTVDFIGSSAGLAGGTYFITQANGTLSNSTGGVGLSSGSWTLNGGSVLAQNNDLTLGTNQIFIQNGGTVQGGLDDFIVQGGASYTLNSGALTAGDDAAFSGGSIKITGGTFGVDNLSAFDGGNFEITGGEMTLNSLGTAGGGANGGQIFNFNGGTTNVIGSFGLFGDTNPNSVFFGGNSTGSLTAASLTYGSGGVTTHSMDWKAGTKMILTLASATEPFWEAEWNAGRLKFDGDNKAALDGLLWSAAKDPGIGLGGGYYWNYNSGAKSLALGFAAVPEPTGALAGLLLGLGLLRRRRNR